MPGAAPPLPPFGSAPAAQRPLTTLTQPPPRPEGNRRRLTFWLLGAAAIVALLVGIGFAASGSDQAAAPSRSGDVGSSSAGENQADLPEEDADPDTASAFIDPFRPDSVAIDATSVWVSDAACGVVVRIDKQTEEILGTVNVGSSASGIAVAAGSVWVGTRDESSVIRIDPARMVVAEAVPVPGFALGLTAQGNDVWATDSLLGVVYRIDAARAEVVETVEVGDRPHHVAIGVGNVWVANTGDNTASLISAGKDRAVVVPVGVQPLHVEIGAGSAWVTDAADGAVRRLDENTGALEAVIDVGVWPHALAFANGAVWVGTETGSFWKVDPATNEATRVENADFASIDAAVDGNTIWIADANGGIVVRFDTATGAVGSVINLNELGDCATFLDEAAEPPTDRSL